MDSLIESIKKFEINSSDDLNIDDLISKLDNLTTENIDNPDREWDVLKDNFSKILYLYRCTDLLRNCDKLKSSLEQFLNSLDSTNQYYLKEIEWDCELIEDSALIKKYLEKSLNENDVFTKLFDIYVSYKLLVDIVEDFRREKNNFDVVPEEFANNFKRRKLN